MAVTITQGKTHSRFGRILADGYNISGDVRSLSQAGVAYEETDFSAWGDDVNVLQQGRGVLSFGPIQTLFNNTPAGTGPINAGSYVALNGIDIDIATYAIGIGEVPTIGCPAFSADVSHISSPLQVPTASPVLIEANFSGVQSGDVGWGQMLSVGTSISSTTSFGSVDNGAGTTAGYLAFLHVVQSAGAMGTNNWSLQIEHSTDDGAWANLGSAFTLDGSAVGAEKASGTGTVNRYVRVTATKTAGTDIIFWLNFIRL